MHSIKHYIKFLLNSSNQHGVHSPFVYQLITKCFYDKSDYKHYEAISNYRKSLLNNTTSIHVEDLGAGSQVMKQQTRTVYNLAKNAGTTYKRAKLLYRLAAYFKPNHVLELGTSLGIATQALSLGHTNGHITSIEGCSKTSKFSETQLKKFEIKNVSFITNNFDDEIKKLTSNTYDIIFFDGNHQKEATLRYFEALLETAHNNSVFIFDDIYWSEGMTEAWNIIKKHPKVTVTIDTFYWGFVFFRREQNKEHFTIRV